MNEITTCLIEKTPLFREGLKSLLIKNGFTPLTELADMEAFKEAGHSECQLIILSADQSPGIIAKSVSAIKERNCNARLVVLSGRADRESIAASFSSGADGFLLKDISARAFIASLGLVLAGEKVFPASMASVITSDWEGWLKHDDRTLAANSQFSTRENDIIGLLAEGQSNKLIANFLNMSEATVKVHLKTILRKLKFSNRTQVAIWAVKNGAQKNGSLKEMAAADARDFLQ